MKMVVALLAAVLALSGCGGDGAEPGASSEATLVLDFTPNAVHAGLYAAQARGWFADEGLDLEIRPPGNSTDAPKLLAAGRAEFAVMDINDLGIRRLVGDFELRPVGALVQVPLASVIVADREDVLRPSDLEGGEVGVTGLPSDVLVLKAILEADGSSIAKVDQTTIGFDAVAALSAGKLDAATAFWNAEGVALRELGIPTREFRLGDLAAKRFPELVVVTTRDFADDQPETVEAMQAALERGYSYASKDPDGALSTLIEAVNGLEREAQEAQMDALAEADAFAAGVEPGTFDPERYINWVNFARDNGIEVSRVTLLKAIR